MEIVNWRKPSRSNGGASGGCVESGDAGDTVGYRDTTQAGLVDRPEIQVSRRAGQGLQAALLAGRFTLD